MLEGCGRKSWFFILLCSSIRTHLEYDGGAGLGGVSSKEGSGVVSWMKEGVGSGLAFSMAMGSSFGGGLDG